MYTNWSYMHQGAGGAAHSKQLRRMNACGLGHVFLLLEGDQVYNICRHNMCMICIYAVGGTSSCCTRTTNQVISTLQYITVHYSTPKSICFYNCIYVYLLLYLCTSAGQVGPQQHCVQRAAAWAARCRGADRLAAGIHIHTRTSPYPSPRKHHIRPYKRVAYSPSLVTTPRACAAGPALRDGRHRARSRLGTPPRA